MVPSFKLQQNVGLLYHSENHSAVSSSQNSEALHEISFRVASAAAQFREIFLRNVFRDRSVQEYLSTQMLPSRSTLTSCGKMEKATPFNDDILLPPLVEINIFFFYFYTILS